MIFHLYNMWHSSLQHWGFASLLIKPEVVSTHVNAQVSYAAPASRIAEGLGFRTAPLYNVQTWGMDQYLLIPFFREMNIHLPAILMFTRGTRFWHTAISLVTFLMGWNSTKKHIWNLDLTSSMMGMAELIWFENILWVSRSVVDLNFLS
jgi:hypothetical protein